MMQRRHRIRRRQEDSGPPSSAVADFGAAGEWPLGSLRSLGTRTLVGSERVARKKRDWYVVSSEW